MSSIPIDRDDPGPDYVRPEEASDAPSSEPDASPPVAIGDLCTVTVSGARNTLYLVPAEESHVFPGDAGQAFVFIYGDTGSAVPRAAYENRWWPIANVPANIHPAPLARTLRRFSGTLVRLADGYQGTRWDGHTHRGQWAHPDDVDQTPWLRPLLVAIENCPTYWDPEEYYAQSGGPERWSEWDDLNMQVAAEWKMAGDDDMPLDSGELRAYLLAQARSWLQADLEQDAPDDDRRRVLRQRFRGWLAQAGEEAVQP